MSTLRQRRVTRASSAPVVVRPNTWDLYWALIPGRKPWKKVSFIVGGIVGICMGIVTAVLLATLHENDLWFSSITYLLERSLPFLPAYGFQEADGECWWAFGLNQQGFSYALLRLMVSVFAINPSGLHDLIYDNRTESMRTINIFKRMNVYQEVFLSILYRIFHIKKFLEPVYFYIYTLFGLQAVYVGALYITSWLLSGTWLSGALAAFWYITNRTDITRVEFSIPLRENWALPLFAVQVAAITFLFRRHLQPIYEVPALLVIFGSTFLFSLAWQFNQFMLLIQAVVLFILDGLDLLPRGKVIWIYIIQIASLLLVCFLQFFNSMIIGSLFLSFNTSILLVIRFQKNLKRGGLFPRLGKLFLHVLLVLGSTIFINSFIKKVLKLESDEHIFKFLKAKFGFGATRDFDANLYLCEEAFGFLPSDTFMRLKGTLVFHSYVFVLLTMTFPAAAVAFHNLSSSHYKVAYILQKCIALLKPAAAYNLVHTILFGLLALSTMRMKYLWTSHMCVFAASGLCNGDLWGLILRLVNLHTPRRVSLIRYLTPIFIILFLCYKFWSGIKTELSELREFYDPDTVELMDWIKTSTPKEAVIAGSMQLLAGVKLCTGRIPTNHPHYEDKNLRERTKQVYQVYARRSAEDVYKILRGFGTDFVILEDSICYERRHSRGCRLRDLLDVANGHTMDGPGENDPDLKPSPYPRFCEEIKSNLSSYTKYFTKVFQNKTFHVYKLAKHVNTSDSSFGKARAS